MDRQNISRLPISEYLYLVPILALTFYIAFIPHQNYLYPLHVDEWVHFWRSRAMLEAGSIVSETGEISASIILISVLFLTIGILSIFIGIRRHLLIKKKG